MYVHIKHIFSILLASGNLHQCPFADKLQEASHTYVMILVRCKKKKNTHKAQQYNYMHLYKSGAEMHFSDDISGHLITRCCMSVDSLFSLLAHACLKQASFIYFFPWNVMHLLA